MIQSEFAIQNMKEKQMNILLADDDHDDCNFFKEALQDLSPLSKLTTLNDGEQLMKHLNDSLLAEHLPPIPDVIFLDINMPRKSGIECLSEIKQNEKLKEIPVVMFSTSNSWDTIKSLFKSGANVYIHKPNDFEQLKQVIQHALPMAAEKIFKNSPIKYLLNA